MNPIKTMIISLIIVNVKVPVLIVQDHLKEGEDHDHVIEVGIGIQNVVVVETVKKITKKMTNQNAARKFASNTCWVNVPKVPKDVHIHMIVNRQRSWNCANSTY